LPARAMELANDADLRLHPPKDAPEDKPARQISHVATASVGIDARLPMSGTILRYCARKRAERSRYFAASHGRQRTLDQGAGRPVGRLQASPDR